MSNETERHREWAARTLKELNACQCADCEKLLADKLTDLQASIAAKLADLEAAPVVYDTDDIADELVRLYQDNEENATTSDLAIAMSNKLKELLVVHVAPDIHDYRESGISIDLERTKYYEDKMTPPKGLEEAVRAFFKSRKYDTKISRKTECGYEFIYYWEINQALINDFLAAVKPLFDALQTELKEAHQCLNRYQGQDYDKLQSDNAALLERCERLDMGIITHAVFCECKVCKEDSDGEK